MPQVPLVGGPQQQLQVGPNVKFQLPDAKTLDAQMPLLQFDRPPQFHADALRPVMGDPSAVFSGKQSTAEGDQLQQFGGQLQDTGRALGYIADNIAVQANAVVVDHALQQAREQAIRLQYGFDDGSGNLKGGFLQKKGYDAIQRDDQDRMLPDAVQASFDEATKSVADKMLTNDAQRRAFDLQIGQVREALYDKATSHMSSEFDSYWNQVYKASVDTGRQSVTADYKNTPLLNKTLDEQDGYVAALGHRQGLPAQAIEAAQGRERARTVAAVIEAAVADKNYAYAQAVVNSYKTTLAADPEYLLKVKGLLGTEVSKSTGQTFAQNLFQRDAAPAFADSNRDRLHTLVGAAESGNREIDPKTGKQITSSAGAKGLMQVQDGTNLDPGYGVKPAKDNSPEERARVGRDYIDALVVHYGGDVEKALAAYNWGPGHLDGMKGDPEGIIKRANRLGVDWRTLLPGDTQSYVKSIKTAYDSGQGSPALPSREEAYAKIDAQFANDPEAKAAATAEYDRHYQAALQDKEQRRAQVTATALKAVDGGVTYDNLPPALKASIDPKDRDMVRAYSDKRVEGDHPTDRAAYFSLTDDTRLRNMSEAELWQYRPLLSNADFDHFANHRAELLKPTQGNGPGQLNSQAFNDGVKMRLAQLGIDTNPKSQQDKARLGAIQKFLTDSILVAQQNAKTPHKFDDAETIAFLDSMFARNINFRQDYLFGTNHGSQNMLSERAGDLLPEHRDQAKAYLKAYGNNNPSEADLLRAHWMLQTGMARLPSNGARIAGAPAGAGR